VQLRDKVAKRAARAGLVLPETVLNGFQSYFELLKKWNQRVSLTALPVRDAGDEAIDRLLIEPALAAKYLPATELRLMDIGSGGGSPAIPMKLASETIAVLMVESKTRKAAFLREAIRQLHLSDTRVESARFEELLARPELHDSADVVTLRAVKVDPKALAAVQSFIRPQGLLYLFTANSATGIVPTPQLVHLGSYSLLAALGTRLEVLRKIS
jgi:16S rRNA (guanine527-N7)-methyltransferase